MGEDGPTDVLSFPLLPPSAFPDHVGKSEDPSSRPVEPPFATPADQIPHLGDVIISMERARAQASGPLGDELRALVVHGVLHICGWDHAETAERDAMRAFERDLLSEP